MGRISTIKEKNFIKSSFFMVKFKYKYNGKKLIKEKAIYYLGLVVKWISRWSSKSKFGVRIPARPPNKIV